MLLPVFNYIYIYIYFIFWQQQKKERALYCQTKRIVFHQYVYGLFLEVSDVCCIFFCLLHPFLAFHALLAVVSIILMRKKGLGKVARFKVSLRHYFFDDNDRYFSHKLVLIVCTETWPTFSQTSNMTLFFFITVLIIHAFIYMSSGILHLIPEINVFFMKFSSKHIKLNEVNMS